MGAILREKPIFKNKYEIRQERARSQVREKTRTLTTSDTVYWYYIRPSWGTEERIEYDLKMTGASMYTDLTFSVYATEAVLDVGLFSLEDLRIRYAMGSHGGIQIFDVPYSQVSSAISYSLELSGDSDKRLHILFNFVDNSIFNVDLSYNFYFLGFGAKIKYNGKYVLFSPSIRPSQSQNFPLGQFFGSVGINNFQGSSWDVFNQVSIKTASTIYEYESVEQSTTNITPLESGDELVGYMPQTTIDSGYFMYNFNVTNRPSPTQFTTGENYSSFQYLNNYMSIYTSYQKGYLYET